MKQTIKRYAELKKLIGQGKTVTLDGRAMNNDKVNAMRMIEVQTAITNEQFKVEAVMPAEPSKEQKENLAAEEFFNRELNRITANRAAEKIAMAAQMNMNAQNRRALMGAANMAGLFGIGI